MTAPSREDLIAFIEEHHAKTVLGTLGVRYTSYEPDAVTVEVDADERLHQHAGIVHGGVYVLLAESAASTAAALSVNVLENRVAGQEINANHLRSAVSGTIRATARPIHRGKTTHVYNIDVTDQDGRLLCVSRCTVAIRPVPSGAD